MKLEILRSTVSDNSFYLVHDGETATLIDPIDAMTAIDAVKRANVRLEWVVNTHFHPDHTGGNDAVFAAFGDAKLCSGPDHSMISGSREVQHIVGHGDTLAAGAVSFEVLETPGHTAGHISLRCGDHLFSGDTIFVGGVGNCRFGGDPSVLFRTFRDVIAKLPDELRFYPGHDYAKRNIEFAFSIEPDHPAALRMLTEVGTDRTGIFLTTLGQERAYNPFFRVSEPVLQAALRQHHADLWADERQHADDDDEATFRTIRALRNDW